MQYEDFPHWLSDLTEALRDDDWVQEHAFFRPGPPMPEAANYSFTLRAYWSDTKMDWCADCYDCQKKDLPITQHPRTFAWFSHVCGECYLNRMEG